jgi:hypothetical protein
MLFSMHNRWHTRWTRAALANTGEKSDVGSEGRTRGTTGGSGQREAGQE